MEIGIVTFLVRCFCGGSVDVLDSIVVGFKVIRRIFRVGNNRLGVLAERAQSQNTSKFTTMHVLPVPKVTPQRHSSEYI
jgi:hypothetical protein